MKPVLVRSPDQASLKQMFKKGKSRSCTHRSREKVSISKSVNHVQVTISHGIPTVWSRGWERIHAMDRRRIA
jgi:hypothetical protein